MTTALQLRRGTTTQHNTFTGAAGEVTVDTTKKTVVVHDGSTAGGTPLAKEATVATKADTAYVDGRLNTTFAFKNRIINGDMRIDQRNAGAAISVNNGALFSVDRWLVEDGCDAVLSAQQSTDAPLGFTNSLRVTATTADASIGSGQYAVITQFIEGLNVADFGWGTANAKPITVSFWVKASVSGQYSFTLYNNGASRINPQPYTINAANTWEYKTITFAGDTTGTWLTNNLRGVTVNFYMALGSSLLGSAGWNGSAIYGITGQANALASTNNIFAITGVQLEVGASATPFDTRAYGAELALCQRYYEPLIGVYGSSTLGFALLSTYYAPSVWYATWHFKQTKRALPTSGLMNGSSWAAGTPAAVYNGLDSIMVNSSSGAGNYVTTSTPNTAIFYADAEL